MLEPLSILIGVAQATKLGVPRSAQCEAPQLRQPSVESKKHGVNGDRYRGGYRSPDEKALEVV